MPERGKNIAIVVLAAGASTRLGQPKQLLRFGDKTLLAQICEVALAVENQQVIVVLGAHCEAIKPAIEQLPVQILTNEKWADGMGSSIACGISHLPKNADAVLLLLCDQPFVTAAFLEKLIEKWRSSNSRIVTSAYGGTFGPPAILDKKLFPELAALHGQHGAKKLMEKYGEHLELVDFPEGAVDIDSPDDLVRLGR